MRRGVRLLGVAATPLGVHLRALTLVRLARTDLRDTLRVGNFETLLGPRLIIEIGNGHARQAGRPLPYWLSALVSAFILCLTIAM